MRSGTILLLSLGTRSTGGVLSLRGWIGFRGSQAILVAQKQAGDQNTSLLVREGAQEKQEIIEAVRTKACSPPLRTERRKAPEVINFLQDGWCQGLTAAQAPPPSY